MQAVTTSLQLLCCTGLLAVSVAAATKPQDDSDVKLLTKASNDLITRLFQVVPGVHSDNVVFSTLGLVQNLAVVCDLSSSTQVKNDTANLLKLQSPSDIDTLRQGLHKLITTFELEAVDGENTTNAAGLFNYLHTNPDHKLSAKYEKRLVTNYRTNISVDTSLEDGHFSVSADTGVLSHWRELEALAVFTFLQHSAAASFYLHNGTERKVPLVPFIGKFQARQEPRFALVKIPLQANSSSVLVVMPKSEEDYTYVTENLNDLAGHLKGHEAKQMEVWLPQLLAVSTFEMKPILQKLGMKSLFEVNFSEVTRSTEPLRLASLAQKSFFSTSFNSIKSITESGAHFTGDAGVRAAQRGENSQRRRRDVPSPPQSLVINKPFLFLITRDDLDLVLTAGCVNDPTQFPQA